jgi:hypothetical protein
MAQVAAVMSQSLVLCALGRLSSLNVKRASRECPIFFQPQVAAMKEYAQNYSISLLWCFVLFQNPSSTYVQILLLEFVVHLSFF